LVVGSNDGAVTTTTSKKPTPPAAAAAATAAAALPRAPVVASPLYTLSDVWALVAPRAGTPVAKIGARNMMEDMSSVAEHVDAALKDAHQETVLQHLFVPLVVMRAHLTLLPDIGPAITRALSMERTHLAHCHNNMYMLVLCDSHGRKPYLYSTAERLCNTLKQAPFRAAALANILSQIMTHAKVIHNRFSALTMETRNFVEHLAGGNVETAQRVLRAPHFGGVCHFAPWLPLDPQTATLVHWRFQPLDKAEHCDLQWLVHKRTAELMMAVYTVSVLHVNLDARVRRAFEQAKLQPHHRNDMASSAARTVITNVATELFQSFKSAWEVLGPNTGGQREVFFAPEEFITRLYAISGGGSGSV
jgi:hypothetical protein